MNLVPDGEVMYFTSGSCKATKLKYFLVVHPPIPQCIHFRQDKIFDTR